MKKLDLTREEAIELWECDNDISENEEQKELQQKAYKVGNEIKRIREIKRTPKKERVKKTDNIKHNIIQAVSESLSKKFNTEITVVTTDKKIRFKVENDYFTLDLVRMTKKTLEKENLI